MSKIISWVIKLGSEKVCVLKSLTKFIWDIFMDFFQILSMDNISLFLLCFETAIHIVDPKIHTKYLTVIESLIWGRKNDVGNCIFTTQQCNQILLGKDRFIDE